MNIAAKGETKVTAICKVSSIKEDQLTSCCPALHCFALDPLYMYMRACNQTPIFMARASARILKLPIIFERVPRDAKLPEILRVVNFHREYWEL